VIGRIEGRCHKTVLLGCPVVEHKVHLGFHGGVGIVVEIRRGIAVRRHGEAEPDEETALLAYILVPRPGDHEEIARAEIGGRFQRESLRL